MPAPQRFTVSAGSEQGLVAQLACLIQGLPSTASPSPWCSARKQRHASSGRCGAHAPHLHPHAAAAGCCVCRLERVPRSCFIHYLRTPMPARLGSSSLRRRSHAGGVLLQRQQPAPRCVPVLQGGRRPGGTRPCCSPPARAQHRRTGRLAPPPLRQGFVDLALVCSFTRMAQALNLRERGAEPKPEVVAQVRPCTRRWCAGTPRLRASGEPGRERRGLRPGREEGRGPGDRRWRRCCAARRRWW